MEPHEQQNRLMLFADALSRTVQDALSEKGMDIFTRVNQTGSAYGLVLYEMGNICEGVRRVLAGEDSPANLASFIQTDERIEEDNRGKIPAIAEEIQRKIFDPVLPILKQAGMPVKEGRVAPVAPRTQPIGPISQISPIGRMAPLGVPPPVSPPRRGEEGAVPAPHPVSREVRAPLEERHLRALLKVASGTGYSEQEMREKFEGLPEGLRRAIASVDTGNAIQNIAKKYLLHVDQMGALGSETGLVLLGFTHPANFVKNLSRRLRIPETRALPIAKDISAEIFAKVRESLRELHQEEARTEDLTAGGDRRREATERHGGERPAPPEKLGILSAQARQRETGGNRQPLEGGPSLPSRTPYSPDARWALGGAPKMKPPLSPRPEREQLTREEVLRGIENPEQLAYKPADGANRQTGAASAGGRVPEPKTPPPAGAVGPTGWRPRAPATIPPDGGIGAMSGKENSGAEPEDYPPPPENRDISAEDLMEKKLSEPVRSQKTEARYSVDPYREPPE